MGMTFLGSYQSYLQSVHANDGSREGSPMNRLKLAFSAQIKLDFLQSILFAVLMEMVQLLRKLPFRDVA
jgi:hypothetical protein